jgi:hypothetical protein
MRTLLRAIATGAAAWAVGVSGVKDNPQFAIFLFIVAIVLFTAAERYRNVRRWRSLRPKTFWVIVVALTVATIAVGSYLAIQFRVPDHLPSTRGARVWHT